MEKAKLQTILHAEVFFDPQAHTRRGVQFADVIEGIHEALQDAGNRLGLSSKLILCFLRDLDTQDAMAILDQALAYKDCIVAVGLDSAEVGNPPAKFTEVFARAREEGFLTVAHAGEEGPAAYVREAIDALHVSRIDHGNRSLDDDALIECLAEPDIKPDRLLDDFGREAVAAIADLGHHRWLRLKVTDGKPNGDVTIPWA